MIHFSETQTWKECDYEQKNKVTWATLLHIDNVDEKEKKNVQNVLGNVCWSHWTGSFPQSTVSCVQAQTEVT